MLGVLGIGEPQTATIVGEFAPKPASVMAFTSANVVVVKVVVFVVLSAELMRASGAGPIAMLGRELRNFTGLPYLQA
jgi:hypothetical protein